MNKRLVISLALVAAIFTTACAEQSTADKTFKITSRPWAKGQKNLPWEEFDTRTVSGLGGFKPVENTKTNIYGGDLESEKLEATGFFRVEKIGDRWWYIDPEGYRYFQKVVVGVRKGTTQRHKDALKEKFGTTKGWISETSDLIHSLAFSGSGSWSDEVTIEEYNASHPESILTRARIVNMMSAYGKKRGGTYQLAGHTGYPNSCIFVFDPGFEEFCDEAAQVLIKDKDDKNIVGYFSDNEMPLGLHNLEGYLTIEDKADHGRVYAEKWLKEKGITAEQITDEHREEFAGLVAERYYRIVSTAFRKYDPNHLYLGSRLHEAPKYVQSILEAAGKYCDVVSINYYGRWTPEVDVMKNWGEWAQKPFIITEFYTKGMDSGLANTSGAGFTVNTQQERGHAYQHFVLGLIESGNCVGWHWFRYQDNDPTAKGVDPSNIDSNKGLVDNDYNHYEPLANSMRELNVNAYRLADWFDARKK